MVTKNIKTLSNVDEKGIEINSCKTISNGVYNNLQVDFDTLICDTTYGDLTIQGFTGGQKGQKITIIKNNENNSIIIQNENSSSTQKIKNCNKCNKNILKNKTGIFDLYCDGTYWYCKEQENGFVFNAAISGSAQTVFTLKNCLAANFNFCVECSTGTANVEIFASKTNLTTTAGKFTQVQNNVSGSMNSKISYKVTFTNTDIILEITTTKVVATVTGEYKILK